MKGIDDILVFSVLFDIYLNTCEHQTSRTIRTEEALVITLARLRPILLKWGTKKADK